MVELDKSQKKIARTLISRALERECCTFLAKLKRLLQDEKAQSCHEKYLEIYKSIQTFDKDISRQYDGLNLSLIHISEPTRPEPSRMPSSA